MLLQTRRRWQIDIVRFLATLKRDDQLLTLDGSKAGHARSPCRQMQHQPKKDAWVTWTRRNRTGVMGMWQVSPVTQLTYVLKFGPQARYARELVWKRSLIQPRTSACSPPSALAVQVFYSPGKNRKHVCHALLPHGCARLHCGQGPPT